MLERDEAQEPITILADLSHGKAAPVPIHLEPGVFDRVKKVLAERNLTPVRVATGIVIFGAVAVGASIAAKKITDKRREDAATPLTDEQVAKFSEMFDANIGAIYAYMHFGVGGEKEEAEDLTQKVFEKAYKGFARFRPQDNLENPQRSWLFRIAHNSLVNYYGREGAKRRKILSLEDTYRFGEEALIDPSLQGINTPLDDALDEPEVIDPLRVAINNLPEGRKLLIYLKLGEGLQNREVGYVMGRSEDAIKSLYHRTLDQLSKAIEGEVYERQDL